MLFKNKPSFFVLLALLFSIQISWAQSTSTPPSLAATGDQAYCPLNEINIVENFTITNPDNEEIKTVYIQISEGYDQGNDILELTGTHPNITASAFDVVEGKIELKWTGTGTPIDSELTAAVKDVIFKSNSPSASGSRTFSITIGQANYLPSTGHYYEYIPSIGITWTDAKIAAENSFYNGLQGYLATITSQEEAQLSGEQAAGAGWIGGSDAAAEGVWKWVTGPEAGGTFWFGNSIENGGTTEGTDYPYANWNSGEPNQDGDEDYTHITAPGVGIPGSWNDLSNEGAENNDYGYQPQGYVVEYGGMPGDPELNISASTKIYIPEIISAPSVENCGPGTVNLEATAAFGDVLWYDEPTDGNLLHTGTNYSPTLSETTTFYVIDSKNVCNPENRTEITATINPLPSITSNVTLKNCDEDGNPDGYTDFNLTNADPIITNGDDTLIVSYYLTLDEAMSGTSPINPSPFNSEDAIDNKVYARVVENLHGCYSIATLNLETIVTNFPADFNYEIEECEIDNNEAIFDLKAATTYFLSTLPPQNLTIHYYQNLNDAQLEENEIISQDSYTSKSANLFVRVESENGDCFGIGPNLTLTVNPRPVFEIPTTAIVCLNLPPITIAPSQISGTYTYEWFDSSGDLISSQPFVIISEGGTYTAIATDDLNCESFPQTITVSESENPTINENDITITDDSSNNTITINNENNNLGIGSYEFALDDGSYQTSNVFEGVSAGIHTIYVQDENNCGSASIEVSVIGYPKFFTPNNDGYNDYWQVSGINGEFYSTSVIYIFDRYGKLITKVNPISEGWDGNYNGQPMPPSDYWFTVQLIDSKGNIREKKGHFSLVRN